MKRATVFVCLVGFPVGVLAAGLLGLKDHFDSFQSANAVRLYQPVAEQAAALERFFDHVIPRTQHDVEQVLGRPHSTSPDSSYAMPLCQSRWLSFGRGLPHAAFYPIGDVGGVQIWYGEDSTIATTVVYLKPDSLFMAYNRKTQNDLGVRLIWDRERLIVLERALERIFGKPAPPNP